MRPRLYDYLGGMTKTLGGHPVEFNGPEDHMHLIVSIPATMPIADFMRELKCDSSNWIHASYPDLAAFSWQDGYSIFTISPSILPAVIKYVRNQVEYHKGVSFRDELIWLLKNHGIEFDEKYLQ
jgi:hypothetical protein